MAKVMRKMPAGGYGYNGRSGTYQGSCDVVEEEISTPCPWCGATAWEDCTRPIWGGYLYIHPSGLHYSRIIAHNERNGRAA